MIKIEHVVLASPEQMEFIIEGMRNLDNSCEKSDSAICYRGIIDCPDNCYYKDKPSECLADIVDEGAYVIGPNDLGLMQRLSNAGTDGRKFMRMMPVYARITAPLYWWNEFDDVFGEDVIAISCLLDHKIREHILSLEDFSCEHLSLHSIDLLDAQIIEINKAILYFREHNDKDDWWQIIQLLPSSYNETRNVKLDYEVLKDIYESKHEDDLDCWRDFCKWIEELPYSELMISPRYITLEEKKDIINKAFTVGNHNPLSQEELKKSYLENHGRG